MLSPLEGAAWAPTPTVGKSAERMPTTAARAERYWASARATVWFETFTFSSKALRSESPKTSHHGALRAASAGWAAFHVTAPAAPAGEGSW